MRYRLYREHKYVCFELTEFDRQTAKTDFTNENEVTSLSEKLTALTSLLKHHARHEDESIHELLRIKGVSIHHHIEADHHAHEDKFNELSEQLEKIQNLSSNDEKICMGHEFYLAYRLFHSELLQHLYYEETTLNDKLQSLYSDNALRTIDAKSYKQMTAEQLVQMMEVLFVHMNSNDRFHFLFDIHQSQPEKFAKAWPQIAPKMSKTEQEQIATQLPIKEIFNPTKDTDTKRPLIGIGVLIFNEDTEILLGKRLNSHGNLTWAPPGGHLEFGESFEACAKREVYEETNLKIAHSTFIGATNDIFTEDNKHYVSLFMRAQFPYNQSIQNKEPEKTLEWQWFDVSNLPSTLFLPLAQFIKTPMFINLFNIA